MMTEEKYTALDHLLKARAHESNFKFMVHEFRYRIEPVKYDDYDELINILVDDELLELQSSGGYSPLLVVTTLGERIARTTGYKAFKEAKSTSEAKQQKKEDLEIRQLEQSVKINKWQFWLMIIGSVGGLISFLVMLYQFLLGSNGFMNDVFNQ